MLTDLRSDTVTRPTKGMLEAMFNAKVGDDVFNEDPTVIALEEKGAKLFGKEAGLFCPSGTMTNQIAINTHTQPGDEVICDAGSHIYHFEGGGIARNSGVQAKLIQGDRGRITGKQIEANINPSADWLTTTTLVSLENTGNKSGGSYYSRKQIEDVAAACRKNKLLLHLDGARIFNALVETGDKPGDIGQYFDSISVCLSKGLGAPIGSLLLGNREFIGRARRVRKVFGGGMRQVGYLAAAGIYALDHHIERLKEDHKRAKELKKLLQSLPYVDSVLPVDTNIVIFTLSEDMPKEKFIQQIGQNDIKAAGFGHQVVRFVTHLDFTDEMLEKVSGVLKTL